MPAEKRTELVKLRLTPAERRQLAAAAEDETSISEFIRKQMFGRRSDTVLAIGRIHEQMLKMASAITEAEDRAKVPEALAYLVAIEAHLCEIIRSRIA